MKVLAVVFVVVVVIIVFPPAGGAALREAYSMSCITNGGTSGRKRDSTSVTRKETLSSAAKR